MCGRSTPPLRREAPGCSPVIGGFVLPRPPFRAPCGVIRSRSVTAPCAPHVLPPRQTACAAPYGGRHHRRYDALGAAYGRLLCAPLQLRSTAEPLDQAGRRTSVGW